MVVDIWAEGQETVRKKSRQNILGREHNTCKGPGVGRKTRTVKGEETVVKAGARSP